MRRLFVWNEQNNNLPPVELLIIKYTVHKYIGIRE